MVKKHLNHAIWQTVDYKELILTSISTLSIHGEQILTLTFKVMVKVRVQVGPTLNNISKNI